MNTTTKRFPRTMQEAFPSHEPVSVSGPYRNRTLAVQRLLWVAITVAAVVVVGLDLFVWRA